MSGIIKDAYEGSWSQQFTTGILDFFQQDLHTQAYILLRFAFDHPFLATPIALLAIIIIFIIIADIQNSFNKFNFGKGRNSWSNVKIKPQNATQKSIDSRPTEPAKPEPLEFDDDIPF